MNLVGDALHNFIDGIIIAASYLISIQVGIATTIAVLLHEIPQEIGDFGVLLHGGFTKAKALFVNFITALFAILGAILTLLLKNSIQNLETILVPIAIALVAAVLQIARVEDFVRRAVGRSTSQVGHSLDVFAAKRAQPPSPHASPGQFQVVANSASRLHAAQIIGQRLRL